MKTFFVIISIGFSLFAQAQTSKDTAQLRVGLERYPEADANKDGVLTLPEAKTFKEKVDKPDGKEGRGDGIRSSYTYKTVGNDKLELFVDTPRRHTKKTKVPAIVFASVEAFTAAMKKAGNRCELVAYEGVSHSFFNRDKYFELTIAEADKFLVGLGWLEKKAEQTAATGASTKSPTKAQP